MMHENKVLGSVNILRALDTGTWIMTTSRVTFFIPRAYGYGNLRYPHLMLGKKWIAGLEEMRLKVSVRSKLGRNSWQRAKHA